MPAIKTAMNRHLSAQAKRDARLRNAINLYHLTPLFYPTAASTSAAASSSQESLDDLIDHTIREDLYFPQKIKESSQNIIAQPPFFLEWGNLFARRYQAVSQGPRDGAPTMRDHHNDGSAFGSIAAHYIGQGMRAQPAPRGATAETEGYTRAPLSSASSSSIASSSSSSPPSISARLEFLSRTARSSLPPSVQPRDNVDGNAPLRDNLQIGSSHVVSFLQLDERSSRIRDAFFGTVGGGTKVGLEVVRERMGKQAEQAEK
ncbi:hypothetical protein BDZ90DRAFT_258433 [Jaminaea rosea]|uniref:Uncharacterized protein n=1 Tax=Jaminaea rosea TaxID=1569628 RepID=A0A316UXL5_9BASI|nr:hypothetical protein BDZ90DRAFT_258433 [Jaminaea rosea]PWN29518.1 hypothetical protein BDZ90DRAFT_258433 [Jaminaea rosea]